MWLNMIIRPVSFVDQYCDTTEQVTTLKGWRDGHTHGSQLDSYGYTTYNIKPRL